MTMTIIYEGLIYLSERLSGADSRRVSYQHGGTFEKQGDFPSFLSGRVSLLMHFFILESYSDFPSCGRKCASRRLTASRRSQPPLALAVPLSRFTSRVGGGSAFLVSWVNHEKTFVRNDRLIFLHGLRFRFWFGNQPLAQSARRSRPFWRARAMR